MWMGSFDHICIYVMLLCILCNCFYFVLIATLSTLSAYFTQPCIYLLMNFKHSWHLYFVFASFERVIVIAYKFVFVDLTRNNARTCHRSNYSIHDITFYKNTMMPMVEKEARPYVEGRMISRKPSCSVPC